MAIKTREEIEALKASWRHDPCWDIEDSEGFEDHKEELLAYRREVEAAAEQRTLEKRAERAKQVLDEIGIADMHSAQYLYTFAEIEIDLKQCDSQIGEASTMGELAALTIAQANARAMLLLAAQVKRVADELEFMRTNQEDEIDRQERLALHRRGN